MFRLSRPAALAACLLTAALAAPSTALAIQGGTDPVASPPTYPGTSTKVNGWQSVGIVKRPAEFNDTWGVSGVLIAPRIVLASRHAAPEKDGTFTLPTGGTAKFVDWATSLTQVRTPLPGDQAPAGDISVAVLDRPLPTPPGGFPRLLTDNVSLDVVSSLPGYVLWNGRGYITEPDHVLAGWQLPDRRLPGGTPLFTYDGDSGSTHFLYTSPTARPLMSAISIRASGDLVFGGLVGQQISLGERLVPNADSSYATVGDWLKAKINGFVAADPTLERPEYATFAQAGIDFASLPPAAPRGIALAANTPSSVTLSWSNPADGRIPRTGYRITDSAKPNERTVVQSSPVTLTGLDPAVEHRFTVRAFNGNGESPVSRIDQRNGSRATQSDEPTGVTYAAPVQGLTVTASRAVAAGPKADYCVVAAWNPATTSTGNVDGYRVTLGGATVIDETPSSQSLLVKLSDGRLSFKRCGLAPDAAQDFTVRTVVDGTPGIVTASSARTPAGAPGGTALAALTNVAATGRVSFSGSKADYCLDITWTAPPVVAGFPVTEYGFALKDQRSTYTTSTTSPGGTTSTTLCGVPMGTFFDITPSAVYGSLVTIRGAVVKTETPLGPVLGSPLPVATNLKVTETKTVLTGRCLNITWTLPTYENAYLLQSQVVSVATAAGAALGTAKTLSTTDSSYKQCSGKANTTYVVTLKANLKLPDGRTTTTQATASITTAP